MATNEIPPNLCIEISLWDRFGWSRADTEILTMQQMRELFVVLEQQRVSRDSVENLGRPDFSRNEKTMTREITSMADANQPPSPH